MKVSIDVRGLMTVTAETPTEAWALKNWSDQALIKVDDTMRMLKTHWRGNMLLIDAGEPENAK